MSWEQSLLDLFDDLEAQAAGLEQVAREEEVADLARAEYAEVALVERLHGSVGLEIGVEMAGGATVRGVLERVGRGCAAVTSSEVPRVMHLVNLEHVRTVSTTSALAEAEAALPVTSRLGMASAVRHLAEDVDEVALLLPDGRRVVGVLTRVGADFLELTPTPVADGAGLLVPLASVVTLAPA
jgi:hypothetical protein